MDEEDRAATRRWDRGTVGLDREQHAHRARVRGGDRRAERIDGDERELARRGIGGEALEEVAHEEAAEVGRRLLVGVLHVDRLDVRLPELLELVPGERRRRLPEL